MVTSGSITQYSPMRTLGPIVAPGSTRAVGAIDAEGSIPDTFRNAAIGVFDTVVLVKGGYGAERLVVQVRFAERFLQFDFEVVQRFELIGSGRFFDSRRSAEEFLESPVHQNPDFFVDRNTGALVNAHSLG